MVASLSGLQAVSLQDGRLRYDLTPPYRLLVQLDPHSGRLAAAELEMDDRRPVDSALLADIEAHAVRTNSLEFLLREAQQRLGLHATLPPPALAPPPPELLAAAAADAAAAAALAPPAPAASAAG